MQQMIRSLSMICFCFALSPGVAATPPSSQIDCGEIVSDRMGVRMQDADGNWRYITASSWLSPITLEGPKKTTVYANVLPQEHLEQILADADRVGPCMPLFAPLLSQVLGAAVTDKENRFVSGQSAPLSSRQGPLLDVAATLYALDGTDLVVWKDRAMYALSNGWTARTLEGLTAADAERLEGFVRTIALGLIEKKVSQLKSVKAQYRDGKLHVDVTGKDDQRKEVKLSFVG